MSDTYDASIAEGVKRFQRRHGLEDDGRLGSSTVEQLNVPLRDRVRQLELTLERWRWLPTEFSAPPIIVNIPDFRLRALDENNKVALEMPVVVGKAMQTQTPVFTRDMTFIVLRPYWNVPSGIFGRTVLPAIKRDRNYCRKRDSKSRPRTAKSSLQEKFPMTCWRNYRPGNSRCGRSPARTIRSASSSSCFPTNTTSICTVRRSGTCLRRTAVISAPAAFGWASLRNSPRGPFAIIPAGHWSASSRVCRSGKDNVTVTAGQARTSVYPLRNRHRLREQRSPFLR